MTRCLYGATNAAGSNFLLQVPNQHDLVYYLVLHDKGVKMSVSLIVVSWNGEQYLSKCLASLQDQTLSPIEVLLIDNGSTDRSIQFAIEAFENIQVVHNRRNLGVATAWNIGANLAKGDVLGFINQDLVADKDWVEQITAALKTFPEGAVIGSKLLYPDGETIQHAGGSVYYPTAFTKHHGQGLANDIQFNTPVEVDYVTGAAFITTWKVFERIGGFDTRFHPAYFEDVDFCVRAHKSGYPVIYWPTAVAIHYESTSLGKGSYAFFRSYHSNRLRFVFKHLDDNELLTGFLRQELNLITDKNGMAPIELQALRWVYEQGEHIIGAARSREITHNIFRTLRAQVATT